MGSHPTLWLRGGLLFCFGLFFGCCWDGISASLSHAPMLAHVGMGGTCAEKHVESHQLAYLRDDKV